MMSGADTFAQNRGASAVKRRPHPGQAGFTLLEVLVVLVITSLITSILFEALAQVYSLRASMGRSMERLEEYVLVENLVRATLISVYPDEDGGKDIFAGEAKEISGLTLTPVAGRYGVPSKFTFQIGEGPVAGSARLSYLDETGKKFMVAEWPDASASFSYRGPDTGWRDSWPPAQGKPHQLPNVIQLTVTEGGSQWTITAAVKSIDIRPLRYEDIIGKPR